MLSLNLVVKCDMHFHWGSFQLYTVENNIIIGLFLAPLIEQTLHDKRWLVPLFPVYLLRLWPEEWLLIQVPSKLEYCKSLFKGEFDLHT